VPPTPTLRPAQKQRALWKVISHLSLNHLSLSDAVEGADALRELLKLYDLTESPHTQDMISGLETVASQRTVARAPDAPGTFCRGLEVKLTFNEEKFHGSGAYLFAGVLDRFLAAYVTINSFSRLVATTRQRSQQQEPWRWPARAGEQILL
jgi:type VI secretion system protein ImpG